MSRLSACIFEWDAADVSELHKAKREQLISQGWPVLTDEDVNKHLTRVELALHCRRRTHGEETTILLLERLLTELMSSKGKDSLGVPLLDRERMEHIWNVQKKHVKCIQDPPWCCALYRDGELNQGRHASEDVQMCKRLHFSRVLSFTSEPFHPRHVFVTHNVHV